MYTYNDHRGGTYNRYALIIVLQRQLLPQFILQFLFLNQIKLNKLS